MGLPPEEEVNSEDTNREPAKLDVSYSSSGRGGGGVAKSFSILEMEGGDGGDSDSGASFSGVCELQCVVVCCSVL